MRVSVIIPIYNVAPYIKRCIDSVIQQSYKDIELILIDDGSTDNSFDIALDVAPVNTLFIRHKENQGLSAARNAGIKAAGGEYLFFLDGDDKLPREAIASLVELAQAYKEEGIVASLGKGTGIDIVQGAYRVIPEGAYNLPIHEDLDTYDPEYQNTVAAIYLRRIPISACGKLINRHFLLEYNLFFEEGILHEDNLWSFQLGQHIHSLVICHKPCYVYFANPQGISQSKISELRIQSFHTLLQSQMESLSPISATRMLQESYILFSAAWMLDTLYCHKYKGLREQVRFVRETLEPLRDNIANHSKKDRMIFRMLHHSPCILHLSKKAYSQIKK